MTDGEDVVIIGDAIRIQGETLDKLERLAVLLGVDPHEAFRVAVSNASAEVRAR